MRTFKYNPELKSYIENILIRRCIQYQFMQDNIISVNLSGTQFHKVIVRARMEFLEQKDFSEYLKTHIDPPVSYMAKSEQYDSKVREEIGSVFIIKE